MKKFITVVLLVLLVFACAACQQSGESADSSPEKAGTPSGKADSSSGKTVKLTIGAASIGGGFHNGASALANAVNSNLDGYELSVEVTGAGAANAALLLAGEVPLGMVDSTTSYEVHRGIEDFAGQDGEALRCVFPGWPGSFITVTLDSSGYNNIADLQGASLSNATTGSSTQLFVARCLGLFGVDYDELGLPNSDAARSLGDGTIDGFSIMHPSSAVSELEASHKIKILTLDEEQKDVFLEKYPQYLWLPIEKDSYKCVPETVYNPGAFNLFCTTSDVDEETIYQVVKSAYENIGDVKSVFPSCAESMTPENLVNSTVPYHAGSVRYFKEKGWDVPEALIPPEAK